MSGRHGFRDSLPEFMDFSHFLGLDHVSGKQQVFVGGGQPGSEGSLGTTSLDKFSGPSTSGSEGRLGHAFQVLASGPLASVA